MRPIGKAITTYLFLCLSLAAAHVSAQTFDENFEHWPIDLKINGRVIINNGIRDFSNVQLLIERVVKGKNVVSVGLDSDGEESQLMMTLKQAIGDDGDIKGVKSAELKKALVQADVVVLSSNQADLSGLETVNDLGPELKQFIERGKTVIVDSAFAACLGSHVFHPPTEGEKTATSEGHNLLPDCVLASGFDGSKTAERDLLAALAKLPGSVGIGIEDETMLMLSGRKCTCYGNGKATFLLASNDRQSARIESIGPLVATGGRVERQLRLRPQDFVVDLTEWRRDAVDRTLPPFPVLHPKKPFVENGTLLIVGGGGLPEGLMERFVELAGGKDKAKLVYVPCSEADDVGERQRMVESWKRMGVEQATFIHTKDRNQSNSDEEFLAPLVDATGIWFGGGRQWNFSDSYYGTRAHKLMKEVLHRGGVIGGSSAGASIQGRYLARATPVGNFRIMAPGYERGGLGFLSGVAIDQHFSQRGRHPDMTRLVDRYPQLLGIGLDEATAIIVQKSKAEIVGRGRVHFYDRNLPVVVGQPDFTALPDGSSYDLATRKVLVETTSESEDDE